MLKTSVPRSPDLNHVQEVQGIETHSAFHVVSPPISVALMPFTMSC